MTLTANKAAPQAPGTTITFTASAAGGIAPYSYKFWTYDGTTWTNFGWSATNTFAWTPNTANAEYQIHVLARNAGNTTNTYDANALTPFAIAPAGVSSATIAANKASPQNLGTSITWTAAASGGTAPYQYKWWVYNGQSWTSTGWTGSNTWVWTPTVANAAYQVMAWVKSAGNSADTYEGLQLVRDPLEVSTPFLVE